MKQFLSFPTYLANVFCTLKKQNELKCQNLRKSCEQENNRKIDCNSTDRFIIKAKELT